MSSTQKNYTAQIAPLLFGSGLCALIYQVAWQREFRLIFGASTAATAAVLAIFIAGLGIGGLLLGSYADRHKRPLSFYALLETLIALSSAATPGLLYLVRKIYLSTGGSLTLGLTSATLLRLVLATLVLAVPTLLMGGTLPAAARSIESEEDEGRRRVALLYGINTLGAVAGCLLSTFCMLEFLGTRQTLWSACLVNLLVAVTAWHLAAKMPSQEDKPTAKAEEEPLVEQTSEKPTPTWFVLLAAAVVGFAFFLMEMVWYRMLAPLLGGSIFTFGLILAFALLGIGLGGLACAFFGQRRRATLAGFAYTCLFEALTMAIPYALGDRLAVLALQLRSLGALGFSGHLLAWSAISAIAVFPAAFVSGVQFPLLIALLGQGRKNVGRQIGQAYAWNTVGAIAGSLAGGFGLLPLLGAQGCWRGVCLGLDVLGLLALILASRLALQRIRSNPAYVPPIMLFVICFFLTMAQGPTSAWRHSAIGVGLEALNPPNSNGIQAFLNNKRGRIVWQAEGVESCVALDTHLGYSLVVNGKNDSNVKRDAGTTIMSGVLGPILHPNVRQAMIVGLGTGSTAGWLGKVQGIEQVDVVELEPAILEIARRCGPANCFVMDNPKVKTVIGDAREVLLTSRKRYDMIFSEPSNPYRAGIASLFTREFYESASSHLGDNGLFLQWVQTYQIDAETLCTIYATLASVFPYVETWQTRPGDMLLVASKTPVRYDAQQLRERMGRDGIRQALLAGWHVDDLEGLLSHYVAGPSLAQHIARREGKSLNTDDKTRIEFGFARTADVGNLIEVNDLRQFVRSWPDSRPAVSGGQVDWARVEDGQSLLLTVSGHAPSPRPELPPDQQARIRAQIAYQAQDTSGVLSAWQSQPRPPVDSREVLMLAWSYADAGLPQAQPLAEKLRPNYPLEADAVLARLFCRQAKPDACAERLKSLFTSLRETPWLNDTLISNALQTAFEMARKAPRLGPELFALVRKPFCVRTADVDRLGAELELARYATKQQAAEIWKELEPNVPWKVELLSARLACYSRANDTRTRQASADLEHYLTNDPLPLELVLGPSKP